MNFKFLFQDIDLIAYLRDQIDSKEKELFLVVSREVENNQGWLVDDNREPNETDTNSITYIEDGLSTDIDFIKTPPAAEVNDNETFQNNQISR